MSEVAGWLASSPLRGCSVEPEEILVPVNVGEQSVNSGPLASGSLCGHSSASRMVRTWCPSRSRWWQDCKTECVPMCAAFLGERGVRNERPMRIPTAPKHRPTGGGCFDCASSLFCLQCMMSECYPTSCCVVVLSLRFSIQREP